MSECISKSKENKTFFIGEESASGIFCDTWDEFVAYLYNAYLERVKNGETQFNVTIEHSVEVQKTKKVVLFERFARICGYFENIIQNWNKAQKAGAILPCPKCGKMSVLADIGANALSRRADIMICSKCGSKEAFNDCLVIKSTLHFGFVARFVDFQVIVLLL